jgi:tetratricopeptide (TPR) repeat protein
MFTPFVRYACFILLMLLALPLLGISNSPSHAQDPFEVEWEDGCVAEVQAVIVPVQGIFDYAAACHTYRACGDPDGIRHPICQLLALETLLQACSPEDRTCQHQAAFFAMTITAFEVAPVNRGVFYFLPLAEMLVQVPLALDHLQQGQEQAALSALAAIPTEIEANRPYSYSIMLDLMRAWLHFRLGDSQLAFERFERVAEEDIQAPLLYYWRAQVYGEAGQTTLASLDAEWLRRYTSDYPQAQTALSPLWVAYPFDAAALQTWQAYPLLTQRDGSGGPYARLVLERAPFEVSVAFYPDLEMAVIFGADRFPYGEGIPRADMIFISPQAEWEAYYETFYFIATWVEAGYKVTLWQLDEGLWGLTQYAQVFEGAGGVQSLLVPPGQPDPRLTLVQECGILSRLRVRMTAQVHPYGDGYTTLDLLYDRPNGTATFYEGEVTLTGPSQCLEGRLWWPVQTEDGQTGWIAENNQQEYRLYPDYRQRYFYICPGGLAPRLILEQSAQVVAGLGANNLRSAPSETAGLVGQIPEGQVVAVLDGPICANGLNWWQVRYGELEGWTAEGAEGRYWLEGLPVTKISQ